jgi:hypothetical protein
MTIIERIGTVNVIQHGAVYIVARNGRILETHTNERDARDHALERADLVDGLAALTIH